MPRLTDSRQALLAAAERLFADRGLEGARTEEIAAAARVNKALLHYYFDTKEKLHQAVLENLFQQLVAQLREPLAGTAPPPRAVMALVERYFSFLEEHPNYPRLLQREMMRDRPYLRQVARRYLQPTFRRAARILRAGIREGTFRPVDVPNTVVSLLGVTAFYFVAAPVVSVVLGWNPYEERRLAARKRAVLDFVRHGLLRTPDKKEK